MSEKKTMRMRRASKTRSRIRRQRGMRLTVFKSPRHFYAQIIDQDQGRVVVSASTTQSDFRKQHSYGGNIEAAGALGKHLAEKALGPCQGNGRRCPGSRVEVLGKVGGRTGLWREIQIKSARTAKALPNS